MHTFRRLRERLCSKSRFVLRFFGWSRPRHFLSRMQADSIQFTHEEVLRYSQLKRDEFTSTSKRIASHAATVSRRKRYRWCRDASSGLYWAWGGLCLAVVKVLPFLDPRPPHAPAKHA